MIQKNNSTDKGLKDRGRRIVKDIRAVLCPGSTGQKNQDLLASLDPFGKKGSYYYYYCYYYSTINNN